MVSQKPIVKKYPETQQEFLEAVVWWFNTERRSVAGNGESCLYGGNGCAIGMWEENTPVDWEGDSVLSIFHELPEFMIALSEDKNKNKGFLSDVQSLHDEEYNWNKNGLSVQGKHKVLDICKNYGLQTPGPRPQVHPYLEPRN